MNAYELESPERKLVMWYKVKEKKELGLTKAQTARELGIDVKTVRKYLEMSYEEFKSSESYRRMYIKVLDPYESKVYSWLDEHPDLSASQIHDWLRERYQDLPM
jgi:transcriptional regulator with XRE-family HTH domain